jgi:hypothetical protein
MSNTRNAYITVVRSTEGKIPNGRTRCRLDRRIMHRYIKYRPTCFEDVECIHLLPFVCSLFKDAFSAT